MKKKLVFLMAVLINTGIYGQDTIPNRFGFGVFFSVQKTIPVYTSDNNVNIITNQRSNFEKQYYSLNYGLKINYKLSSHFTIESSVNYLKYK